MDTREGNVEVLNRVNHDFTFKSVGGEFGGIIVTSTSLKPNQTYSLSYDLTKIDGEINRIGGHIGISDKMKVFINGEEQIINPIPETSTNLFSYGLPYNMQDNETIHVEVVFLTNTYDKEIYPDKPLKIQPNRFFKDASNVGFGVPYTAKVENIRLEVG